MTAVDDFSLAIADEPPSITALVGESGSGKTTLARLLLGLIDLQDTVLGRKARNTGHKALRARAVVDLADHIGWERAHGRDPASPPGDFNDPNADPDGDGYTLLEDYLDELAAPRGRRGRGGADGPISDVVPRAADAGR